jgi:hypothetical protein
MRLISEAYPGRSSTPIPHYCADVLHQDSFDGREVANANRRTKFRRTVWHGLLPVPSTIIPTGQNHLVQVNCSALRSISGKRKHFGMKRLVYRCGELRVGRVRRRMGSIFLDALGGMDLSLQAKILRVLEEREFERVGGQRQSRWM